MIGPLQRFLILASAVSVIVACSSPYKSVVPTRQIAEGGRTPASENTSAASPVDFEVLDSHGRAILKVHRFPRVNNGGNCPSPCGTGPLIYKGGPVQESPKIYVVYWGFSSDPYGEETTLNNFLAGVSGTTWLNTVSQYDSSSQGDIFNSSGEFGGAWSDNSSTPAPSPTEQAMALEAVNAAAHFGYSADANYIVALPQGSKPSWFLTQNCAEHGTYSSIYGPLAYTVLPYLPGTTCNDSGTNDGVIVLAGHEIAETQTDPQLNAWSDSTTPKAEEIGDKCAWDVQSVTLANGTYPVQSLYSDTTDSCIYSFPFVSPVSDCTTQLNAVIAQYGSQNPPDADPFGGNEGATYTPENNIGSNTWEWSYSVTYTSSGGGQTSGSFYTQSGTTRCVSYFSWNDTEQKGRWSSGGTW